MSKPGIGAALAGLTLSAALRVGVWLRDILRRLTHFNELSEGAAVASRARDTETAVNSAPRSPPWGTPTLGAGLFLP